MPNTSTSSIDDAVEKFVAKSRYTLQERRGVMRDSLNFEALPLNEGPNVTVPKYGQVTTTGLTEGVDMTNAQEILDAPTVVTPGEYGAKVILTKMMLMTVRDSFFTVATNILRDSFDRQQDQTLCDDMDNFSNALGSAAAALNIGHVMAGHASLKYNAPANGAAGRGGEPAPDPISLVITPSQIHSLRKTLIGGVGAAAATQITPETERAKKVEGSFTIDGIPGLTIKSDINIQKDTSDDAKGGMFSKMAIQGAELGGTEVDKDYDQSLRAWEVVIVGRWGRTEYDDNFGREFLFDSALPTS
jgi:ribosomal protein S7